MNIQRWIARREPDWKRLDALLKQVERKGLKSLRANEIKLLASLYRSVSADLARIRSNPVSQSLTQELQLLTSRGYNQIYQGSRRQEWNSALEFCLWGFPATVQRNFAYIAVATALFLLGGLIGWWFSWRDPAFMALVVPEELISKVRDRGELWMGSIIGIEPLASSGIMINNIAVSLFAIFGGVTMFLPEIPMLTPPGVFTVYLLFMNGLLIGAVATLVGQNNLAYPFWAFVFPHGSLELPAIFFAGGAGLLLARGILFPGKYRRPDALRYYGIQAAQLVCGIIPLLVVAGVIEGFFSPNPAIPDAFKYLAGITLFALLVAYCSRRKPKEEGSGSGE
ncbi:stage II sporulation protein M [Oscillatoria sp. FACHB-1407]|uniref:stage II sporulation protein M n=1 Tax=Oscillatoria sp. FACHB-1407 TaxID=2692847 RepID=UPI00168339CD|nr:stage II sporulation protein M [Oscillatoria sp. FACHB-1407]MBD2460469.1 stage II sporulation protein M [Oscillatoria sp. FACHB-1407]